MNKFKVGDKVRIKIKQTIFNKGDLKKYSDEVYIIKEIKDKKYLLDNDKYYSPRTLKLENEIVKYQPTQEEVKEEEEFKTFHKEKNLNKELRAEGLDKNNVVEGKRVRKKEIVHNVKTF